MTGTWGLGHADQRRTSALVAGAFLMTLLLLLTTQSVFAAGSEQESDPETNEEELEMGLPLSMTGWLEAESDRGAFSLGPLDGSASEFTLRLEAAKVKVSVTDYETTSLTGREVTTPLTSPHEGKPETKKYGPFVDAKLALDEAHEGFYLLAHDDDDGADFRMEPLSLAAQLDVTEEEETHSYRKDPGEHDFRYTTEQGSLRFTGDDPFAVTTGNFTVVFFETPLDLQHENGVKHFEAGRDEHQGRVGLIPGGIQADPLTRTQTRYVVMEVQEARLAVRSLDAPSELMTPMGAMKVDVDGTVESPSLLGSVRMGGETVHPQGDPARMDGRFTLQPTEANGKDKAVVTVDGEVETLTVGPKQYESQSTAAKTAGFALILAGLGAAVWQLAKGGFLLPLYAKLTRGKVLDQGTRQLVHDKIQEDPGCTTRSVASALGISWSTAAYHLRVLRHMGLVTAQRRGRHDHHFLSGVRSVTHQAIQAALQNPTTRRIAALITEHPGIIQKDICRMLNIAPSTASDHLKRLRETGAVREEKNWRTRAYHPSQALHEVPVTPAPYAQPVASAAAQSPA